MGTSGTLTAGGSVEVTAGDDLTGAAITADTHTTLPSGEVSIACAPDIAPAGFTPLGPAVSFGAEGTWSDRAFLLTLPYKAARLPKNATHAAVRIGLGGDDFAGHVEVRGLAPQAPDGEQRRADQRDQCDQDQDQPLVLGLERGRHLPLPVAAAQAGA